MTRVVFMLVALHFDLAVDELLTQVRGGHRSNVGGELVRAYPPVAAVERHHLGCIVDRRRPVARHVARRQNLAHPVLALLVDRDKEHPAALGTPFGVQHLGHLSDDPLGGTVVAQHHDMREADRQRADGNLA